MKMNTISNIMRRYEKIVDKVLEAKREKNNYAYWSLYLDDTRLNPREIDTCATSFCVSLLLKESDINSKYEEVISKGINTLVYIRQKDGSWPSVVNPNSLDNQDNSSKGVVAIGDTCFALTALLDAGFLREDYKYCPLSNKALEKLNARCDYFEKSVDWLLDNKAIRDGGGWYYTDTKDCRTSVPVVLATSNVVILLSRIIKELRVSGLENTRMTEKMQQSIDAALKMLLSNINSDGGIGKAIVSDLSCPTSYIHTVRFIDVLVSCGTVDDADDLKEALSYVIGDYEKVKKELDNSMKEDIYVEKYCLSTGKGEEISISHENYVEVMLIKMLLDVYKHSFLEKNICFIAIDDIMRNRICDLLNDLIDSLKRLQEKGGKYNGLFRCRVSRPEGSFPVYASFYAIQSAKLYNDTFFPTIQSCDQNLVNACKVKCKALKNRLSNAISTFGLNKDYLTVTSSFSDFEEEIQGFLNELDKTTNEEQINEITRRVDEIEAYYNSKMVENK